MPLGPLSADCRLSFLFTFIDTAAISALMASLYATSLRFSLRRLAALSAIYWSLSIDTPFHFHVTEAVGICQTLS
jgi:hypothetical protein